MDGTNPRTGLPGGRGPNRGGRNTRRGGGGSSFPDSGGGPNEGRTGFRFRGRAPPGTRVQGLLPAFRRVRSSRPETPRAPPGPCPPAAAPSARDPRPGSRRRRREPRPPREERHRAVARVVPRRRTKDAKEKPLARRCRDADSGTKGLAKRWLVTGVSIAGEDSILRARGKEKNKPMLNGLAYFLHSFNLRHSRSLLLFQPFRRSQSPSED